MRIAVKLLVTYLILIAGVAVAVGVGLPRIVEREVREAEQLRLRTLAEKQAAAVSEKLNTVVKTRPLVGLVAVREALKDVGEWTVPGDILAFVDAKCEVLRASDPTIQGKRVENCTPQTEQVLKKGQKAPQMLKLEDNPNVILALAPLSTKVEALEGASLLLIRKVAYIQELADPIARRLRFVVILALIAALGIAGFISREMARRLRDAGKAAQAIAEGDLAIRVPEKGDDEITELARHINHMAERVQTLVEGLRKSEQARKELLVVVSHELRTPMTSIAGFAEALSDGVVRDEERKARYYQIIAAEATRLNRLINDLFDVAKLEAGQVELRMHALAVVPFLVDFAEGFSPVATGAGVQLELLIDPGVEGSRIYADRDRLDQVLTNLCSNAVRFSPAGERITLQARAEGEDLVLSVSDRGPGLSPEEASHVFQRFFQGRNKGRGHKGAGLGLAIVKSLVDAHGGQVGVQSTPGEGATFWIRLKRLSPGQS